MATIYEVSELAGVSLATVSRVMNNSSKVKQKTREKVLAAMAELDYQPNGMAQSLASNRSNCIGVMVSELHGPIFGSMLSTIELALRKAGKFAIFTAGHNDAEKEKEGIRFLAGRNCDALILHVESLPNEFFIDNKDSLLPFVLINRHSDLMADNCISLDNEIGGYYATRSLLEQGHRQIAYISGPLKWADAQARLAGHRRALQEYGVEFDERLLLEGDYRVTGGAAATEQFLAQDLSVTAIVCANDEMAAGAMGSIRKQGLFIPDDISVVGFDNVRWAKFLSPQLSTIDFPVADMSNMAVNWIMKNVYGNDQLDITHLFEPKMVQRASTSRIFGRKNRKA